MRPSSLLAIACLLCTPVLSACGGDTKTDTKQTEVKSDAKGADAKGADAKGADAKAAELHFDITQDKSGVLARTASVLETSEVVSADDPVRGHLANLSHHAEAGKSNEALCKHIASVRGDQADSPEDCAVVLEHERVHLGPEVFKQMEQCIVEATTPDALERCEKAEKEAEAALHEKKHGDGLAEDVCDKLFVHFETLAMEDAGDQAEVVKGILEEVHADVVESCVEQGTQKELDCAMAAKTMDELGECESTVL